MTKIKNALSGLAIAAGLLATIFSQFSIIKFVREVTGWTMPRWLAITIAGLTLISAITLAIGSSGVSLPAAVIAACKWITAAGS